jgi:hypothetical protein
MWRGPRKIKGREQQPSTFPTAWHQKRAPSDKPTYREQSTEHSDMLVSIVGKPEGIAKLKTGLMREIDVLLAVAGFRRVRDRFYGDLYCREDSGVRHGISVGAVGYLQGVLEAEVGAVSLRFHEVEALVARMEDPHPLIDARALAARSTLFVRVSESDRVVRHLLRGWGGTKRKVWLVHSHEDVPRTASEIAAFALEHGEPILADLSDSNRALEILSGDDEEARTYSGPDDVRAMKAIALALLLRGEPAARELSEVKLQRMRGDAVGTLRRAVVRLFEHRHSTE